MVDAGYRNQAGMPTLALPLLFGNGALFFDIKSELHTPRQQPPIDGFFEILYADDTLIFGENTHCVNFLYARERHSVYFGLVLNYGKCVILLQSKAIFGEVLRCMSSSGCIGAVKKIGDIPWEPC